MNGAKTEVDCRIDLPKRFSRFGLALLESHDLVSLCPRGAWLQAWIEHGPLFSMFCFVCQRYSQRLEKAAIVKRQNADFKHVDGGGADACVRWGRRLVLAASPRACRGRRGDRLPKSGCTPCAPTRSKRRFYAGGAHHRSGRPYGSANAGRRSGEPHPNFAVTLGRATHRVHSYTTACLRNLPSRYPHVGGATNLSAHPC